MVGGMNDLCELINIWNLEIIMTTTTSGKEDAILVLEKLYFLEINSYPH